MQSVSATEAKKSFAAVIDAAAKSPVIIRRQKRDVAVVMSMDEYRRLKGVLVAEFLRVADDAAAEAKRNGLTEKILEKLLSRDGE